MRSSLGSPEVPCARCGARVAGIAFGERCPKCQLERDTRARRLAWRISLVATVAAAAWIMTRVSPDPTARLYGGVAVLCVLFFTRKIVHRAAMEFLRD